MLKDFYFRRFAGPIVGTAAAAVLFTVDHNQQWLVTHIRVVNTTTSAQTFKMSIGVDAAGTRIYDTYSVATGGLHDWQADSPYNAIVLYGGETLEWNGPATLTVTVEGVVAKREAADLL